jgi:hypothetical protein
MTTLSGSQGESALCLNRTVHETGDSGPAGQRAKLAETEHGNR